MKYFVKILLVLGLALCHAPLVWASEDEAPETETEESEEISDDGDDEFEDEEETAEEDTPTPEQKVAPVPPAAAPTPAPVATPDLTPSTPVAVPKIIPAKKAAKKEVKFKGLKTVKSACSMRESPDSASKELSKLKVGNKIWVEEVNESWFQVNRKAGKAYVNIDCVN